MSSIRQIRSLSHNPQGGGGRGGYSSGGHSGSQGQDQGSRTPDWGASMGLGMGGPIIHPPLSFHDIPIINF